MDSVTARNDGAAASPLELRVGDTLDTLRTFRVSILAPLLMGLIMLFDSWDSIAIAYVMPSLSKEWGLHPAMMGALISSGYIGQFMGAVLLGSLAERYGRMPVFISSVVVMAVLALACTVAPGPEALLVIRFIQGLAIGGALPVSITYINELAPTLTRGRYFMIFQWLCMSGYAAASLSSTVIIPTLGWRWLIGLGGIPLLLLPIVMLTLPESPRWLARTGRAARVPAALAKLGGKLPPEDVALATAQSQNIAARQAQEPARIPISALFAARQRRSTIILMSIWFTVAFTNFGLTTWAPSIFVTVYNIPLADALRYAALTPILFLIATPFIGATMDKFGRRPYAITGCLAAGSALVLLALFRFDTPVLVALVVIGTLGSSLSSFIQWPYTAESYPTHLRAVGMGVCSSMARAASMLTPLFVGVILNTGAAIALVYSAFAAFAFGAASLWIFATRETARRKLETI
ncbi:MAG: MFS transporter [Sphingobium phenoxybenzoativorans]